MKRSVENGVARLAVGPREAAEMLGISPRLLWTWTKAGRIPHIRLGRRVLYNIEELRAWLASQSVGGN